MCLFKKLDTEKIDELQISNHIEKLDILYQKTYEYLDKKFKKEIQKSTKEIFHQRWVEMLTLYKLLHEKFIPLKPSKEGNQPDIRININSNIEVWIECTAPEVGEYKEALKLQNKKNQEASLVPINDLLSKTGTAIKKKIRFFNNQNFIENENLPNELKKILNAILVDYTKINIRS